MPTISTNGRLRRARAWYVLTYPAPTIPTLILGLWDGSVTKIPYYSRLHIQGRPGDGPLRVVQFVETLNTGGLEVLAVNLATAQRKAGHSPSIYTLFEAGDLAQRAREQGIPVTAFR